MSRTCTVEFGDRGFWAYDVSLSILLVRVVEAGEDLPAGRRPSWLREVLDRLRVQAVVPDLGFVVDLSWPTGHADLLVTLLARAADRLAAQGTLTAGEVAAWDVHDGASIDLRGEPVVDLAPVVELGRATIDLIRGTLPQPPAGTWWFYGVEGGPRTVRMDGMPEDKLR